ncbi:MAG: HlyD family efflux transporter periplasmic adaptor subunit [Acidobacteriota bacterium]
MDRPRTGVGRRKSARRIAAATGGLALVALLTLGLSRLEPGAFAVERATVWIDTVERGSMIRQVRSNGTLVPEEIRWVTAGSDGRVERILAEPGSAVTAGSVIVELGNPELELAALEARSRWRGAEAELTELRVRLESQRLDQAAAAARVQSEYAQARMRADADDSLAEQGLVADLTRKLSRVAADELASRRDLEGRRLVIAADAVTARLDVQAQEVEQRRALFLLRQSQLDAMKVRAGIDGVLQQVPLEIGQRVVPGTNLARVARPDRLKGALRVPEILAKDIQVGQPASVDTRNGIVAGHVSRIDPAVQNGTVTVDVALEGELPRGVRPDLSVEGTIELERIADVVHVGRPARAEPGAALGIYRLVAGTNEAIRVPVHLGRASVNTVEVVEGLEPGDRVILSDTSGWDAHDRVRLY